MRSVLARAATALCLAAAVSAQQVCNNAAALCAKPYNNVTHLGAHDSPFVRDPSNLETPAGDQFYNSTAQLSSGVRLLSAQVHQDGSAWNLCHTSCLLYNAGSLEAWLADIKAWLDGNPSEVVTLLLVNSDNANATVLDGIFRAAQIADYAYAPNNTRAPQQVWPTLATLIASNKRLVTFIASLDPASNTVAPYLLDEFTFVFENNYDNDNVTAFSCEANRPPSLDGNTTAALDAGMLPLVNHFLYDDIDGIEIPAVEHVDNTNAPSGSQGNLGEAAATCTAQYGRAPSFFLVDFANVGPAIATVDQLNGVTGMTSGRLALPSSVAGSLLDPDA